MLSTWFRSRFGVMPRRSAVMVLTVAAMMASAVPAHAQNWSVPGGNLWRQRTASLPLQSSDLAVAYRLPAPGLPRDTLIADIDGDPARELVLAVGGRLRAYDFTGALEWSTSPVGISKALPPVDLDGDQRPDLIALRDPSGVAVVRGRDGLVAWKSSLEDLGRVGSTLVDDFNGDGLPDVLFAEADCGAPTRKVGRGIAYSFSDLQSPTELFRLEEGTRDYYCGRFMALADLDGDGRREIVAPSSTRIHVYSSRTGEHLGATPEFSPPLPYGVAQVFVADIDGDGRDEVLLLTNNNYPPSRNSRRAMLVERDDDTGKLTVSWDINVDDVGEDRHEWPDEPLVDLDGDGRVEFIHSFFNHQQDAWTTFVRNPSTGDVIAQTQGRVVGVVERAGKQPWILLAGIHPNKLVATVFGASGFRAVTTLTGDDLLTTRQVWRPSGRVRSIARIDATSPYFYLLDNQDDSGQELSEHHVHAFSGDGTEVATFTYEAHDSFESGYVNGTTAFTHVHRDSGRVDLLDEAFEPIATAKSIVSPGQETDEVLGARDPADERVRLGRRQAFYSLVGANLGQPADRGVRAMNLMGLFDANADGRSDWLVQNTHYRADLPDVALLDGTSGDPLWSVDDLVEQNPVHKVFWLDSVLGSDISGDGLPDVVLQTDAPGLDKFDLTVLDGASGQRLWGAPFELPSTRGGLTGPPVVVGSGNAAQVVTSLASTLYAISGTDGALQTKQSGLFYSCCLSAWPGAEGSAPELVLDADVYGRWVSFDDALSEQWVQDTIYRDNHARYSGRGASLVRGQTRRFVIEGRAASLPLDHNFVVLDADSGDIIHRLVLQDGAVRTPNDQPATESLNAGVGFNATTTHGALYLTSSRDGYLYLLRPGADPASPSYPDNVLVKSWDLGVELGDVSAVDVDGDGFSEPIVPTLDGSVLIMDEPTLQMSLSVRDTDCSGSSRDVDSISFTDHFCASWTLPALTVEGYVATLIDMDSAAPVGDPVDVGAQTSVRFHDIRLLAGRRYQVAVQAYHGTGADARVSRVFASDGAEVVDSGEAPVILGPEAQPSAFVPGRQTTLVTATLRDPSPLASYALQIHSPDGEVVFQTDGQLNTSEYNLEAEWDGLGQDGEPLAPGTYEIVVSATDFTGLTSSASAPVELQSRQALPHLFELESGCGCENVPQHSPLPRGLLWVGVVAMVGVFQRRRRRD